MTTKKHRKAGGRPSVYTKPVKNAIICLWEFFNFRCGKRLVLIIRININAFRDSTEFSTAPEEVLHALERISPATVDRLLVKERKKLSIKDHGYTRGTVDLKDQIPIRTFGDWKDIGVGHFQIDCVGHDEVSSLGSAASL